MNTKQKGIIFTMIATILFGITPAVGKLTYAMGNNGVQLAFLRHLFVLPLFFIIVVYQGQSLRLNKSQWLDVFKVGFFGNTLTIVMLYSSYEYIGVGSATVLHFLYPLFVVCMNFVLYHQKLNKQQLCCLVLAIIGIFCFMDSSSSSLMGALLAILSGVVLLQKGIYCLGASLTAILSTLEPITSIVVGVVWLNESLTLLKIIGCILVLFSTFILVKAQNQQEDI